jgi:hypothetical protein
MDMRNKNQDTKKEEPRNQDARNQRRKAIEIQRKNKKNSNLKVQRVSEIRRPFELFFLFFL